MGNRRRKKHSGDAGSPVEGGRRSENAGSKAGKAGVRRRRPWYYGKQPIFKFVLLFGVFMGLFELVSATTFVRETAFPWYLRWNASASVKILGLFEDSVHATGQAISGRASLTIERGCDAVEPSALFLAGVLAFPAAFPSKIPGMMIGTFCLMVLNLVRIVSLYYVRVYWPRAFHIMHVDVWQAVFIFLAILAWVLWALWATRAVEAKSHVRTTPG